MTNIEDNGQIALSHDPGASGREAFPTCGLNWGAVSRQCLRPGGWGQARLSSGAMGVPPLLSELQRGY